MIDLSEDFWEKKYSTQKTGWDLGKISTPLKQYFNQLKDKNTRILIPGAGNSYEATYLFNHGFYNVFVIDLVKDPLRNLKERTPNFPKENLIQGDFFNLKDSFDLIIEQTFFCAINPNLRQRYAEQMHQLLTKKGKLVGLLFDAKLNEEHPPFGGNQKEYENYFRPFFDINIMEPCSNSMEGRKGKELFIKFTKRASNS